MKSAFTGTILVWAILVLTSLGYAAIDSGSIVGLWLLDEGAGTAAADSSGNGNDGTFIGDPEWVNGKFGKAVQFDGDGDYIECADSDSLDMTDQITVMCWFKTDKAMVEFEDRQALVGKHYLEYEVGVYPGGVIHTYTNDGTGDGYDEGINASIAEELAESDWVVGSWYHVAWTLDGLHEIVYVNGVNIGEFDKGHANTLPGDNALEIGQRVGGSLPFTGAIDEVAVLNVALDEADIQAAMQTGLAAVLDTTAVSSAAKLATTWGNIKN
jgi:hypothetical protein